MTENLPKITVITATFNLIKDGREAFFRQCVESVHNQTYPNIEHIVMDGASTDGTLNLIREYEEKGWLKCYSEPDEGMWDGMNKGLRRATGDYIQFLNSDDFFISNKVLEECATVMANKQTDYLFGNFCICDKNNNISRQIASLPIELFWYHQPYNHEALFVKKSVYLRLGGYDLKYKTTIDYAFIIFGVV